jgi:excisionase family DNA binding protein
MGKTYNVTREVAAKSLNISTRTIDRYIKSGKLSYKKIANKVLLAKEEVVLLKQEFTTLHQELNTEIINQSNTTGLANQ